jgi:hypothetical protein
VVRTGRERGAGVGHHAGPPHTNTLGITMKDERVRFAEHLAVATPMSLESFCSIIRREFDLPNFTAHFSHPHPALLSIQYMFSEGRLVEKGGIEYNISRHIPRPFEPETLQIGSAVPYDCNFGVTLIVSNDCPESESVAWGSSELVPGVAQRLANALGQKVHHYQTWLGVGKGTIARDQVFRPGEH